MNARLLNLFIQVDLAGVNRNVLDDLVESPTHGPRPSGGSETSASGGQVRPVGSNP